MEIDEFDRQRRWTARASIEAATHAWCAIRRAFRSLRNERDRKSTHVRMVRESLGCGFLGCTLPDLPEDWDDNRTSVCTVGDCNHD